MAAGYGCLASCHRLAIGVLVGSGRSNQPAVYALGESGHLGVRLVACMCSQVSTKSNVNMAQLHTAHDL